MLSELKAFSSSARYDTEELVALAMFGRAYEAEFSELKYQAPEWLANNLKAVRREIRTRNADALQNKLRSAKARLESLKSADEKRVDLQKEIELLEAQASEV